MCAFFIFQYHGTFLGVPHSSFYGFDFNPAVVFFTEFIGSALLTFGIILFFIDIEKYGRRPAVVAAIFLAINCVFTVTSSAVFNPLLHLSMALVVIVFAGDTAKDVAEPFRTLDWIYYVAPLIGTITSIFFYCIIFNVFNIGNSIRYSNLLKRFKETTENTNFLKRNASAALEKFSLMSSQQK